MGLLDKGKFQQTWYLKKNKIDPQDQRCIKSWFIQIVCWPSGIHPVIHIYIHINIQMDRKQKVKYNTEQCRTIILFGICSIFDSRQIVKCLWWFLYWVDELETWFIYYNYWSSDSVMFTLLKLAKWYLNLLCYFRVAYLLFDIWSWCQGKFSDAKFIPPNFKS